MLRTALRLGPHDQADTFRTHLFGQRPETASFRLIGDAPRDTNVVLAGQPHEVAAGHGKVGDHTRPFRAEGLFGHLHDDRISLLQYVPYRGMSGTRRCVTVVLFSVVQSIVDI